MRKSLLGLAFAAGILMAVAGTGNAYANDGVLKAKRELAKYVIDHGSANAENQTRLVTASCYNGKYMGIIVVVHKDLDALAEEILSTFKFTK